MSTRFETRCATCGGHIVFDGASVQCAREGFGPVWCDHVCAPRMRWERARTWDEERARNREIAKRRQAVAEARR